MRHPKLQGWCVSFGPGVAPRGMDTGGDAVAAHAAFAIRVAHQSEITDGLRLYSRQAAAASSCR